MKKIFSLFAAVLFAGSMMAATEMTCAEAAAAAKAGSTDEVTVQGYVTEIATVWSSQYKNISFWLSDEGNGENTIQAFRCAAETLEVAPEVGDLVKVTGTLALYNSIPEFAAGCTFEMIEKGAVAPPAEDADVVFEMTDFAGMGTADTGSEVELTKDGVTFWCDKAYGTESAGVRCYKGSNVKISAETQIGKLVFEFDAAKDGGLSNTVVVNALAWEYTLSESQARFKKIKVYFGEFEPEPEPEPEVTPEVPEGVLTCAGAVEFAATVPEEPTAEQKEVEVGDVVVRGFVSFCYDLKPGETQQSAWLADLKSAKAGVVQAYYAEVTEAVAKGDYVEAAGKLVKYFKAGKDGKPDEIIFEIKNGTMKKVDPLAVENVFTTVKAQKVMMNGTLYIIRGNKMFDVRGAQVR
jgi:hypothetical protein